MEEQGPPGIPGQPYAQAPGHEHQHQKAQPDEHFLALSRQVSDLLSRLRLLEERYANLRREHQTTSQNMIENHQNLSKQQRKLSDGIVDVKRTVHDLNEQLMTMQGELADAAKSHDLKVLERYISYWEPLEFVTRAEADRLIDEALQRPNLYKSPLLEKDDNGGAIPTDSTSQDDASARNGQ